MESVCSAWFVCTVPFNAFIFHHCCLNVDCILQRSYGAIKLDVTKVACDWYEYLVNKEAGAPNYKGEFMKQYSWAESENGNLSKEVYYGNE